MKTFENSTEVHESHLQMVSGDNYELQILGKNGEAKPFFPSNLNFNHVYRGHVAAQLTTDEHGKLYLG